MNLHDLETLGQLLHTWVIEQRERPEEERLSDETLDKASSTLNMIGAELIGKRFR